MEMCTELVAETKEMKIKHHLNGNTSTDSLSQTNDENNHFQTKKK